MFIGRSRELAKLNELYQSDTFQFPVIYGRRRVGKTALLNEFIKGKDTIFFTGIESNAGQNLENFSKSIFALEHAALEGSVFASFQAALEYVFRLAETRRIVLVMDEYPYAARASKSLASTLQMLIDQNKDTSKLFLILCGSSMSFMENHVLAYKAPLYGRRTAQFKLRPFDFFEAKQCVEGFLPTDMATVYGIVGGTPQYLLQMDDSLPLEANIKRSFLDAASPLFEEPGNLLKQELREPAVYNAAISAIASGSSRLSEIASKVGEETGACAAYLKNLIALGIVKKETPFAQNTARKTIYRVEDQLFRFWYRFVPGNVSAIQRGFADEVYQKIAPQLSTYMGTVFEEICTQYLWRLRAKSKSKIAFTDLGRWWGTDAKTKREAEIDIMGTDGANAALFAECKWTNEAADAAVLDVLDANSRLFAYREVQLYLFAKSGFTKDCREKAAALGNVTLVSFEEIWEEDFS